MRVIDADALLKSIDRIYIPSSCSMTAVRLCDAIDKAPTVDAVPVVHGRWKEITADEMYGSGSYEIAGYICTKCGFDIERNDYYNYCPHCGAKMGSEEKNAIN